jgi:hypothetical protein
VQKWYYRIGLLLLLAGAVYLYFNWNSLQPVFGFNTGVKRSKSLNPFAPKDKLGWQIFKSDDDSYRVEIPAKPKEESVSAFNVDGSTEPVHMFVSHIDGNVAYAVAWADNPPIARLTHSSPDNLLDTARDGAMERTHTRLITETHITVQGFSARDFQASTQPGTAFLYARLIYAGQRLYMLLVIYPNAESLHEQDTVRFFNSLKIGQGNAGAASDTTSPQKESQLPESIPAAQVPAGQGQ